jgi:Bacterial regulatory protein, Fis family
LRHAQELGLRIAPHLRNLVESYFTVFLGSSLDEVEREFIRRTIALADGNKARASEMLGVPRRTLYGKLERYDARHKSQRERVPPFERRTPGYMLRDLADIHNREGRSIDEIAEQLEAEPDEVRTWLHFPITAHLTASTYRQEPNMYGKWTATITWSARGSLCLAAKPIGL